MPRLGLRRRSARVGTIVVAAAVAAAVDADSQK
jgi:hypothetical protein